jgi:hypothetical protein
VKTLQQWFLLFAGALAGVIGSFLLMKYETLISMHKGLSYATLLLLLLLILGVLPFQKIVDSFLLWRSKKKPYVIGILCDMGWDEKRPYSQFATGTKITIEEWKDQLKNDAKKNNVSIEIRSVTLKENLYRYTAVINPYGGVYPEVDLANATSLSKIFDYVSKGGVFVNVADVPGFWAYNVMLQRRSVASPPIRTVKEDASGAISVNSFSIVAFAPFVQKLWLNVNPHEKNESIRWKDPVRYGTERFQQEVPNMMIHRLAVVERNVEPVLTLVNSNATDVEEMTPLFFAVYDKGKFLISLIFQDFDKNNNNQKIKEILSLVLIQAIK